MKPRPHPERPDRLRAIAASLATAGTLSLANFLFSVRDLVNPCFWRHTRNAILIFAGIFPGRCHPISAREITREELKMVGGQFLNLSLEA